MYMRKFHRYTFGMYPEEINQTIAQGYVARMFTASLIIHESKKPGNLNAHQHGNDYTDWEVAVQ